MRLLLLAALLTACGAHPTSCPTVGDIKGGGPREAEIIVERCAADSWATSVTTCLRNAKDEAAQEQCLHALTPDQGKRLKAAFAPLDDADEAAERAVSFGKLAKEIDGYHLEQFVARAPACKHYLAALAAAQNKLLSCPKDGELRAFGLHRRLVAQVRALTAITDDAQLAGLCTTDAAAVTDDVDGCE